MAPLADATDFAAAAGADQDTPRIKRRPRLSPGQKAVNRAHARGLRVDSEITTVVSSTNTYWSHGVTGFSAPGPVNLCTISVQQKACTATTVNSTRPACRLTDDLAPAVGDNPP